MNTLLGKPVQISFAYPSMQVSSEFERIQHPDLVAKTNAWMAEFFGMKETVPDGEVWQIFNGTLIMNQATFDKATAAMERKGGAA